MSSSIEELKYHLVFCTKYRYKLLTAEIAGKLKEYALLKQDSWQVSIISLAIEPDHVHILLQAKSSLVDMNKVVKKIKGSTSHYIRRIFNKLQVYPALFSPSHFLATTGDVSKDTIQKYIKSQGLQETEFVKRTFVYKVLEPNKDKKHQLDTWLGNVSSRPKGLQQSFRAKDLDKRIFLRNDLIAVEKKNDKYWLALPGGNGWKRIWVGLIGRDLPEDCRIKDSFIVKKEDDYFVLLCIEQERIIENKFQENILAVDLGISHPITAALLEKNNLRDSFYFGDEIKNLMHRRSERFKKLQKHKVKKNLGKKLARYTRAIDDYIHKYTREIVDEAKRKSAILVVGNIHNITRRWDKKEKTRNRTFRRKAKPTPYAKIMQRLFYKGTLSSLQVVFQDEAFTSQRCSRCGELGCRRGELFECKCGYKNQADLNGAINIAAAFQRDHNDLVRQLGSFQETHEFICG